MVTQVVRGVAVSDMTTRAAEKHWVRIQYLPSGETLQMREREHLRRPQSTSGQVREVYECERACGEGIWECECECTCVRSYGDR